VLVVLVLALVVLAQAPPEQVPRVLRPLVLPPPKAQALAQRGHAQVVLASPVKAPPRTPRCLARTLA
jgi:hypothetical protein